MPFLSMLSLSASGLAFLAPGFIAAIIGLLVFALSVPERVLVGIIALAASFSAMLFFLVFCVGMPTPNYLTHKFFNFATALFAFYGSPFLFMSLTMIVGFSQAPKRKSILLCLCVSGLIAAVIHTIVTLHIMRGMA